MRIVIEDLTFKAILGILDFERDTPQNVIINLSIDYTYSENEFIDYAAVVKTLKKRMKKKKFYLIEDALRNLSKKLKKKFPQISVLQIKITKPSILPDCRVSVEDTFYFDS